MSVIHWSTERLSSRGPSLEETKRKIQLDCVVQRSDMSECQKQCYRNCLRRREGFRSLQRKPETRAICNAQLAIEPDPFQSTAPVRLLPCEAQFISNIVDGFYYIYASLNSHDHHSERATAMEKIWRKKKLLTTFDSIAKYGAGDLFAS